MPLVFDGKILRRLLLVAVALAAGIGPVLAQPKPQPPRAKPGAKTAEPARTGECAKLPGGRAPAEKIAALTTGLSPRDLDLAYFGKALADLTPEDFQLIAELSERCGAGPGILSADQLQKFETVVREAQQSRRKVMDGIKKQMTEIGSLPIARDKLERLNGLTESLPRLEPAMTRSDVQTTASWIARQSQALYDAAPKPPPPVTRASTAPVFSGLVAQPAPSAPRRVPGREDQ